MFCVSNVKTLIKYYNLFQKKKDDGEHDLRIATIFSYSANEENEEADGFTTFDDDMVAITGNKKEYRHSREERDKFIEDYNQMFGCNYSSKDNQGFYNYYKDIARRVKIEKLIFYL